MSGSEGRIENFWEIGGDVSACLRKVGVGLGDEVAIGWMS
jgi:hypothetical protein